MAPVMPPRGHPSKRCGALAGRREGPLQEKEVRQMTDRDKNSGSSNVNQSGMGGSSSRSGSQSDQQSGSQGRSGQSGSSSQGGIRDDASTGEGSSQRGSQSGSQSGSSGMRAPSGSDELSGDTSRTGQSGQ